ncbi:MAG: hypothetical protein ABSG98_00955 [Anaerolineales bacterium]|jgi:hypothetical protein
MLLILAAWAVLGLVFSGIGLGVRRAFALPTPDVEAWLASFWIGWAALIAALQIVNFFAPVGLPVGLAFIALGVIGLGLEARGLLARLGRTLRRHWVFVLAWIAVGAFLAIEAMGPIGLGDTARYHLSATAWDKAYAVVPGLGNLDAPLAYNNAYFLYTALLDQGPFQNNAAQLANGLLLLLAAGQGLVGLAHVLRRQRPVLPHHLFDALLLAPILMHATSDTFASLSPDSGLFSLGIILSSLVLRALTESEDFGRRPYTLFSIWLIAAAGTAVKLSFLAPGAVACLISLAVWARSAPGGALRPAARALVAPVLAVCVLAAGYVGRAVLLSGYLGFPSTLAPLPVAWRMSAQNVLANESWIWTRSRNPDLPSSQAYLPHNWFPLWLSKLSRFAVYPLIGSVLLGIPALALGIAQRRRRKPPLLWLFPLFPLISLVFWFLTAPSYRFAGAFFWILLMGMAVVVSDQFGWLTGFHRVPWVILVWAASLVFLIPLRAIPVSISPAHLIDPPDGSRYPTYQTLATESGLELKVPVGGGDCWNLPIPCTRSFSPRIELLRPGDLGGGFRLGP